MSSYLGGFKYLICGFVKQVIADNSSRKKMRRLRVVRNKNYAILVLDVAS